MKTLAHITLLALINTTLAQSPKASTSVASFVDITANSGVNFTGVASHTSHKYLMETMGSGVATFDYDNDGLLDIIFVNGAALTDPTPQGTIPQKSGPQDWNRFYHQKKDGTFEDVTEKAGLKGIGYGMGVAVGDYDNDGFEDLYVTAYGGNNLYHNNGNGTFTDVTETSGTGGPTGPPQPHGLTSTTTASSTLSSSATSCGTSKTYGAASTVRVTEPTATPISFPPSLRSSTTTMATDTSPKWQRKSAWILSAKALVSPLATLIATEKSMSLWRTTP